MRDIALGSGLANQACLPQARQSLMHTVNSENDEPNLPGIRRCVRRRARSSAKLLWAASAALGALALGLSGCGPRESPLRVGANVWPGYEPLFLARSLGYYREQPIQLMEFSSTAEVIRAYRNGLIDVAALTADEALRVVGTQPGHRIVLVCDASKGADVLLAKPEFHSLQELKGRRVGVETTALGAFMLARALDHAGMSAADLVIVPVPLPEHERAFLAGQVDAVVTFEPHRSRLLAAGARRLFDSSQIPWEVVDVLLARRELSAAKRQALAALVAGWFDALKHLREQPADAAARMAPREGVTPREFLDSLQGLELPDRETNLRLLGPSTNNLAGVLRQLSAVMLKHRMIPRVGDPALLLDDRIVQTAKP